MFLPQDKDSDQHVSTYKWLSDSTRPVHPPYYYLFYCPECFFTDVSEDYASPERDEHNITVAKTFKNLGEKERAVIDLIGRHIEYSEINWESAVNLHYLALLAQVFPNKFGREPYKIARLMLRTAWLFRENTPDTEGYRHVPTVDQMNAALTPLDSTLHKAQEDWDRVALAVNQRITELAQEIPENSNPYTAGLASVESAIEQLVSALHHLKTLGRDDVAGTLTQDSGAGARGFFEFRSYEAFLAKLKTLCPILPTDEREAMRTAIRFFEQALASDIRLDNPQAHFAVVTLIADLHIRCDDIDAAFGMVRGMYKAASDSRLHAQKELDENKANLDESQRNRLAQRIRKANTALGEASELRNKLLDLLTERDLPKIRALIEKNPGLSQPELDKLLEDNGILPGLVVHLRKRNRI